MPISVRDIHSRYNIAIVVSRFNEKITQVLVEGALHRLRELEFSDDQVTLVSVPGAIEIPITAQRLAKTRNYAAIIALGAVVRGETSHYDYVCEQVSWGCQHVALTQDIPVIFGVLTTETTAQAMERAGGVHGHKGRDAVDTAIEMVATLCRVV